MYKKLISFAISLLIIISAITIIADTGQSNNDATKPLTVIGSGIKSPGFLYETLLLNNNSLIMGNYIRDLISNKPANEFYDPLENLIYVSYYYSNNVSLFNASSMQFLKNITLPFSYAGFILNNRNGNILIYSYLSKDLIILNKTGEEIGNVSLGNSPINLIFNQKNNIIYSLEWSGAIELLNASTFAEIKQFDLFTGAMSYNPDNGYVYVLNFNNSSNSLIFINNTRIVKWIPLNGIGFSLTVDYLNNIVLVQSKQNIDEFNASTGSLILSIPDDHYMIDDCSMLINLYYCPVNGYIYAISPTLSKISVLSINGTYITSFNTDSIPSISQQGIIYDYAMQSILLLDTGSDSISIIPLNIYTVNFHENGLESGTEWSVTLNGITKESLNDTISFIAGNGTYSYSIEVPTGYNLTNSSGIINVSGDILFINLNFISPQTLYKINVYSAGLPVGVEWEITIGNATQVTYNLADNALCQYGFVTLYLPTGTYKYSIFSPGYHVVSPFPINWTWPSSSPFQPYINSLTNLSSSGYIHIDNSQAFYDLIAYFRITTYKIVFEETGLPNGTYWYVNLKNGAIGSNKNVIIFNLPNGTYNLNIATAGSSSCLAEPEYAAPLDIINGFNSTVTNITIKIDSTGKQINVTFTRNYSYVYANFTFLQYPTFYTKAIIIDNITLYSVFNNTISFLLPKGNYSAHILSIINDNMIQPILGTFFNSWLFQYENFSLQSNLNINVTFLPPKGYYAVKIISGLSPDNSSLFAQIQNQIQNKSNYYENSLMSDNGTILTYLPNGTYSIVGVLMYSNFSYNLSLQYMNYDNFYTYVYNSLLVSYTINSYYYTEENFTVKGQNETVNINFLKKYVITLNVSGLLQGEEIQITINGEHIISENNLISIVVPNGSYNYSVNVIGANGQIYLQNGSGNILVNGSNVAIFVTIIRPAYLTGYVTPSNATLEINGLTYIVKNGTFNITLKPGIYQIIASAQGYNTYVKNITLNSSEIKSLNIHLTKKTNQAPNFGTAAIVSFIITIIAIGIISSLIFRQRSKK